MDARAAVVLTEGLLRQVSRPEVDAMLPSEIEDPQVRKLCEAKRDHDARRFESAERLFLEAGAASLERGDSLGALVAFEQRATTLQDAGHTAEARREFSRVREWAVRWNRPLAATSAGYGLAYGSIAAGESDDAVHHAGTVRREAAKRNLPEWLGHAEYLLYVLARDTLDVAMAERHLHASHDAYLASGNRSRQAACLRNIASLHGERAEYPEMIELLRAGEALAHEAGDIREASFCLEHRASVHHSLGDIAAAARQWKAALALGENLWAPEWQMTTWARVAGALRELGREEEAASALGRAIRVLDSLPSQRSRSGLLVEIGRFQRETGATAEALSTLAEAVTSAEEWGLALVEGSAWIESGRCHLEMGNVTSAQKAFERAEAVAGRRGFYALDLATLSGLAGVARALGDFPRAWNHLAVALDVSESVRERSRAVSALEREALVQSRTLYEESVDLLHARYLEDPNGGFAEEAFLVGQRAKARSLNDLLVETGLDLDPLAGSERSDPGRALLLEIAKLVLEEADGSRAARGEIDRLEDELALMEKREREADPRYAEVLYPHPAEIEDVQAALRPGELLLEYQLGAAASHLFAVTESKLRFVKLPPRAMLEQALESWLPYLSDYNLLGPDPTYFLGPASDLFETLLGPVRDMVQESRVLLASPDDVLHYLPFEAVLVESEGNERTYRELDYLVTRVDVGYVPSATSLVRQRDGRQPRPRAYDAELLLVGAPTVDLEDGSLFLRAAVGRSSLGPADLDRETERLPRSFRQGQSRVLRGPAATHSGLLGALDAQSFRYVHFATHGVFNERRPRFSGLLLASGEETYDDGFLSAGEVTGLPLRCEQVVLSACSSALGESIRGEGMIGLTRAFLYAGAPSVIAALWEVSGSSTADLMEQLYQQISGGGVSGTHALSESKRAMIRSGVPDSDEADPAHPYAWAGFLFVGDGR